MSKRSMIVRCVMLAAVLCPMALPGQDKPAIAGGAGARDFPVTMRQNVVAGKTPVGTKVEAKLAVATLVDGTVIPRDATFTGEVVESSAKSASDPSRLAIRMDSVQWKKGSAPVKVYLTAWYYPMRAAESPDLTYGTPGPIGKTWNGAGAYPDPSSPASQPFPSGGPAKGPDVTPTTTASVISSHPTLMKDVLSMRKSDGTVSITSSRFNIKLDKLTTYVLATGDPAPAK